MKSKFKFSITTFALFLILFNSICFASNTEHETMLISDIPNIPETVTTNSDLYIIESEYEISNTVNGNVFILANKFTLKTKCEIDGDLYICAKEVVLEQNSKIDGNVFICSNNIILNSEITGSLYANSQNFDMQYFAFISRDLYLNAKEVKLNGWIYRNSFITAENIITQDKFINQGNLTVADADNLTFSGEILGDAIINVKNISFKNKENDNSLICKISGNLSYSSNKKLEIQDGIVSKEIQYSNYINTKSNIWIYVLILIISLVFIYIIYLFISKKNSKNK